MIMAITAVIIIFVQTLYRDFYLNFPWSVNEFHTVKYKASLGFINPDNQSVLVLITGVVVVLFVLLFYREAHEHPEI